MVKLTNAKIKWIVRHVENGNITTRQAADIYNISIRRVQQLVKEYREKGRIPKLNKNKIIKPCFAIYFYVTHG